MLAMKLRHIKTLSITGMFALAGLLPGIGGSVLAAPKTAATSSKTTTTSVKVVSNVTYYSDPGAVLDEYLPGSKSRTPTPAVVFVHGGAWAGGDKAEWNTYVSNLVSSTGWPAFNINYDMDTAAEYITEPRDVTAAVNWVKDHAGTFNIDPARVGLVGDSAGGHLALLAATTGTGLPSAANRVKAVVSWSGPSDFTQLNSDLGCLDVVCNSTTQWLGYSIQRFEGMVLQPDDPQRWSDTSPINQVDPTDPKTLLFNSAAEIIPLNQMQNMAAALQANGVPVQTVTYAGTAHALNYGSQAWPTTLSWLKTNL